LEWKIVAGRNHQVLLGRGIYEPKKKEEFSGSNKERGEKSGILK